MTDKKELKAEDIKKEIPVLLGELTQARLYLFIPQQDYQQLLFKSFDIVSILSNEIWGKEEMVRLHLEHVRSKMENLARSMGVDVDLNLTKEKAQEKPGIDPDDMMPEQLAQYHWEKQREATPEKKYQAAKRLVDQTIRAIKDKIKEIKMSGASIEQIRKASELDQMKLIQEAFKYADGMKELAETIIKEKDLEHATLMIELTEIREAESLEEQNRLFRIFYEKMDAKS